MFQCRQGDVLITQIDKEELPKKLESVPREDGRVILAHGEATGHAHAVEGDVQLLSKPDTDEMTERFLKVIKKAEVVHEEHDTLTLPEGIFKITRQREYVPKNAPRPVYD